MAVCKLLLFSYFDCCTIRSQQSQLVFFGTLVWTLCIIKDSFVPLGPVEPIKKVSCFFDTFVQKLCVQSVLLFYIVCINPQIGLDTHTTANSRASLGMLCGTLDNYVTLKIATSDNKI